MLLSRLELDRVPAEAEGLADPKDAAETVVLHPATNAEVQALCEDLQVLGRSEFKALLKWCAIVIALARFQHRTSCVHTAETVVRHPATNEEVQALCEDLRGLERSGAKAIIFQ